MPMYHIDLPTIDIAGTLDLHVLSRMSYLAVGGRRPRSFLVTRPMACSPLWI